MAIVVSDRPRPVPPYSSGTFRLNHPFLAKESKYSLGNSAFSSFCLQYSSPNEERRLERELLRSFCSSVSSKSIKLSFRLAGMTYLSLRVFFPHFLLFFSEKSSWGLRA